MRWLECLDGGLLFSWSDISSSSPFPPLSPLFTEITRWSPSFLCFTLIQSNLHTLMLHVAWLHGFDDVEYSHALVRWKYFFSLFGAFGRVSSLRLPATDVLRSTSCVSRLREGKKPRRWPRWWPPLTSLASACLSMRRTV